LTDTFINKKFKDVTGRSPLQLWAGRLCLPLRKNHLSTVKSKLLAGEKSQYWNQLFVVEVPNL